MQRTSLDRFEHLLGVLPDATVARLAGAKPRSVTAYRRRNDIPTLLQSQSVDLPRARRSSITPFVHLIGLLGDAEIAKKAGVVEGAITGFRRRHGIPRLRELQRLREELEELSEADLGEPVAEEPIPPTLHAVPDTTPVPTNGSTGRWAFRVKLDVDDGPGVEGYVVVATDLPGAAAVAVARLGGRAVRSIKVMGEAL
jgi:hypothetical protein